MKPRYSLIPLKLLSAGIAAVFIAFVHVPAHAGAIVADHVSGLRFSRIPRAWIERTKTDLHVAYEHTSHGSQIVTGMNALKNFPPFGSLYDWDDSGQRPGALDLDDYGIPAACNDLSQGDRIDGNGVTPWVTGTRNLLDDPANYHINVVVWSWCSINGHDIDRYLTNMEILVSEYGPGGTKPRAALHPVQFVFMTGHAEGQGEGGFIHAANEQIRDHCRQNHRVLFDFADMENYDPDGVYYYDRPMWDNLDYTGSAYRDSNWAQEWIAANPGTELERLTTGEAVDGYDGCAGCAHSDSPSEANLNCVLKARAFWWLMARLAGWNGGRAPVSMHLLLSE